MNRANDFLMGARLMMKLYDGMQKGLRDRYGLTGLELQVINFLHNHPGMDTAAEIAELRGLPKGNVSVAVESLIQKSLLSRKQDEKDRRRIHLSLRPEAEPIVTEIKECKELYRKAIFKNISEEDLVFYNELSGRIWKNVEEEMERIAGR